MKSCCDTIIINTCNASMMFMIIWSYMHLIMLNQKVICVTVYITVEAKLIFFDLFSLMKYCTSGQNVWFCLRFYCVSVHWCHFRTWPWVHFTNTRWDHMSKSFQSFKQTTMPKSRLAYHVISSGCDTQPLDITRYANEIFARYRPIFWIDSDTELVYLFRSTP